MSEPSPPRPNLAPPRPGHTPTTSPPRPLAIGEGEGAHLGAYPNVPLEEELQERLKATVAETLRRRVSRAAIRRDLDARRQAGLTARHAQKLARKDSAMSDADKITLDLSDVGPGDRRQLAGALAHVASMRNVVPQVAVALGRLATAVLHSVPGGTR